MFQPLPPKLDRGILREDCREKAVSPPDINNGFVNARDSAIPRVLYVKNSVRLNIAGNDEAMPPSSGPPSWLNITARATMLPPASALNATRANEYTICTLPTWGSFIFTLNR